jgi:ATP-dependent protease HslVU (ClpYQ) peptidase subunit
MLLLLSLLPTAAAPTAPAAAAGGAQVRRIGASAVGGFAGVAVDGLSLLERLEGKLEEHPGQLQRAAVELAKMWRQVGARQAAVSCATCT